LACLERRSYGEPALLNSGVEPGDGGQMPGKKYLTNAKTTKEGFTGKERDKHSGLDYFGARYGACPGAGRERRDWEVVECGFKKGIIPKY
jgi:hypothetical protein